MSVWWIVFATCLKMANFLCHITLFVVTICFPVGTCGKEFFFATSVASACVNGLEVCTFLCMELGWVGKAKKKLVA